MAHIGTCLFLGIAVLASVSTPSRAGQPVKTISIAVLAIGNSPGGTADPTRIAATRALVESLRRLGARVTSGVIAAAPAPGKMQRAAATRPRAVDGGSADVVLAVSTGRAYRTGAYTSHLAILVRIELFAVDADSPPRVLSARRERRLPGGCLKICQIRIGTRMAEDQVQSLAPGILRWSSTVVSRTERRLAFRGFSQRELGEIRQYLRVFPGFRRMGHERRMAQEKGKARDGIITYRSRLTDRALESALRKMLGHMRMSAAISSRGRDFKIVRNSGVARPDLLTRDW